jgi:hypothetical protein
MSHRVLFTSLVGVVLKGAQGACNAVKGAFSACDALNAPFSTHSQKTTPEL